MLTKAAFVIFLWKPWFIIYHECVLNRKFQRTVLICNQKLFFNIVKVFTVTLNQFNEPLLNRSIHFFSILKILLTPNF